MFFLSFSSFYLCFFNIFCYIGPVLLVLEFCSRGTLESNLRESQKNRQLFNTKAKMGLENEIAKGMSHLADSRVTAECCIIFNA